MSFLAGFMAGLVVFGRWALRQLNDE